MSQELSHTSTSPLQIDSTAIKKAGVEFEQSIISLKSEEASLAIKRERIEHHLLSAYRELGGFEYPAFQKHTIAALRELKNSAELTDPIVGEVYLTAVQAIVIRVRSESFRSPLFVKAAEHYLDLAHDFMNNSKDIDPTFEVRTELLRHQLYHNDNDQYLRANIEEIDFINWLLQLKTTESAATNQIISLANAEALRKHLYSLDTIAYPMLKKTLEFAKENPNVEKTWLVQTYANYGYSLAFAYGNNNVVSYQNRDAANDLGIAALRKAESLCARVCKRDSYAYGNIQIQLLSLYLNSDKVNLEEASEVSTELRQWMHSSEKISSVGVIRNWLDLEYTFIKQKHGMHQLTGAEPDFKERQKAYYDEMLPIVERALVLFDRLPRSQRPEDYLDALRIDLIDDMISTDQSEKALILCKPFNFELGAIFTDKEQKLLELQFYAQMGVGDYEEAKKCAELYLKDLQHKDPAMICAYQHLRARIEFVIPMLEVDPNWSATILAEAIPYFGLFTNESLDRALFVATRCSYLADNQQGFSQWIKNLEIADQIAMSDQEEIGTVQQFDPEEEEGDDDQASIGTAPLTINTIYKNHSLLTQQFLEDEMDMDLVDELLKEVREFRDEHQNVLERGPTLISECYYIDGHFHLRIGEPEKAEELFQQALSYLSPKNHICRPYIAQNFYRLGQVEALRKNFAASSELILKALSIYKSLPYPNRNVMEAYAQLGINHSNMGDEEQENLYASTAREVMEYLKQIPPLPTKLERIPLLSDDLTI